MMYVMLCPLALRVARDSLTGASKVVSFKLAALRRPFEARDDLTLTMKIVKDPPNALPKDTPADVACAVLGLLHKA